MTVQNITRRAPKRPPADPWEYLQHELQALHACIHDVGSKVDKIDDKVDGISGRVSTLEGYQQGIASRLGVPAEGEKQKHPIGLMGRGKAVAAMAAAVFGAVTAAVAAYPFLVNLARAVHESLLLSAP